jgi:hypothetical protein
MIPAINILLGDVGIRIGFCSSQYAGLSKRFEEIFGVFLSLPEFSCKKLLYLLVIDPNGLDQRTYLEYFSEIKVFRLSGFHRDLSLAYHRFIQMRSLDMPPYLITGTFCYTVPQPLLGANNNQVSILVFDEHEEKYAPHIWSYIIRVVGKWAVEQNGLLLHSAAVIRDKRGFLFLGRSGAGKTTLSSLSHSIGCLVLGDELNIIYCAVGNKYNLYAVPCPNAFPAGYSSDSPALNGIFNLVQDGEDYLVQLTPEKISFLLFDSFINDTPIDRRMTDVQINLARNTCNEIARNIPGYELHFRKSPDFWNVIDDQFPVQS